MESRVEEVEGSEYLILTDGDKTYQIDLRALSSWGMLLGLTDESEIVGAILRFQDKPSKLGEPNVWTPMFDALGQGLDELSQVGVPPEYVEDVLESDAPFPTPETTSMIHEARAKGRQEMESFPDVLGDNASAITEVLVGHCDKIKAGRVEFVDKLAPTYELPAPPEPVVENVVDIVIPTLDSDLGAPTDA